jgi:uncharacterized protein (DUF3084 family)
MVPVLNSALTNSLHSRNVHLRFYEAEYGKMAEQPVDLAFLGEQMKSLQTHARSMNAEVTVIREKVVLVEAEQVELRDNLFHATGELTVRMGRVEHRVAGLEQQIGGLANRIEGLDANTTVRFERANQTAATNLQIVLSAISGLDKKIEALSPKV